MLFSPGDNRMSCSAEHVCFSNLSASALSRQRVCVYTSTKGKHGADLKLIYLPDQINNLAEVIFLDLENIEKYLNGIPACL